jgi:hypothetical protein
VVSLERPLVDRFRWGNLYRFGSGPAQGGADKVAAAENAPVSSAAARSFFPILGGVLLFAITGPVTLVAVDFWEQISCKTFRVMCDRTNIINWSRELSYERGPGDTHQSLRFFFRSDVKKEKI